MPSGTTIFLCGLLFAVFPPTTLISNDDEPRPASEYRPSVHNKTEVFVDWPLRLFVQISGNVTRHKWVQMKVSFRPTTVQYAPDTLQWNSTAGHYEANVSHALNNSGTIVYQVDNRPDLAYNFRMIERPFPYLQFPGVAYEFEFENTFEEDHVTIRKIYPDGTLGPVEEDQFAKGSQGFRKIHKIIRKPAVLPTVPKSGAGCFYVYHTDANSRTVKVYWKPSYQADENNVTCEILVREDIEGGSRIVYQGTVPLSMGALSMNISSLSHWFNFTSVNSAGRSLNSSLVHVPAQKDLIPTLISTNVSKNQDKGTIVLRWEPPANVSVSNYTVSWLDTYDSRIKGASRMRDYVVVAGDKKSFEVKADGLISLGVSVNNANSSSGLTVVQYTL